ncbi:hypothetical protein SapgrDRAFT_0894 [Saprospira grandis DSM 2844]|uniref:Lipoprotein n=1 Tax=Saprospira grandis DSM 2844 TaxID=694433 RepID=J0XUL6_9BACT|nr:hypothetical protein [Saprospira grandis]EJF52626.1 hypothetical protein SapgrDRAFT_0894 [Saprospira grandis DSM 2844]
MKIYAFFLAILAISLVSCQSAPKSSVTDELASFPKKEFAKVVAYDYESMQGDYILNKNGELHPSVKAEKELTEEQQKLLLATLNSKNSYGGSVTRCFYPRLGFVFYNAADEPVGQVSICFQCNQQVAGPQIPVQEALLAEGELIGYSALGREKLLELCQSLGFSNCNE